MALAIDGSTPAINGNTKNSSAFSPPANSLIVVLWMSGFANTVSAVSDSLGSHLTYTHLIGAAGFGDVQADIWVADCPSAQTGMTVQLTASGNGTVAVVVMTGAAAAASQTGATGSQATLSGGHSVTVSTTADGSLVMGAFGSRYTVDPSSTVGSGQTLTFGSQSLSTNTDPSGDYQFCQVRTANTATSGTSVTINNTKDPSEAVLVVAEILAASGGGASVTYPQLERYGFRGEFRGEAH